MHANHSQQRSEANTQVLHCFAGSLSEGGSKASTHIPVSTSELTRVVDMRVPHASASHATDITVHSHTEACLGGPDAEAVADHIQEAGRPQASAGSEAHHAWVVITSNRSQPFSESVRAGNEVQSLLFGHAAAAHA